MTPSPNQDPTTICCGVPKPQAPILCSFTPKHEGVHSWEQTPTTANSELRKLLAKTKTFNYDVYYGQDITNDCIPYEEALDEVAELIQSLLSEARKGYAPDEDPYDMERIAALEQNRPLVKEKQCEHYQTGYNSGYIAGQRRAQLNPQKPGEEEV